MTPFHLTVLSFSILAMLHQSLKGIFFLVEKAHEHLRETDHRTSGGELVKGSGA